MVGGSSYFPKSSVKCEVIDESGISSEWASQERMESEEFQRRVETSQEEEEEVTTLEEVMFSEREIPEDSRPHEEEQVPIILLSDR